MTGSSWACCGVAARRDGRGCRPLTDRPRTAPLREERPTWARPSPARVVGRARRVHGRSPLRFGRRSRPETMRGLSRLRSGSWVSSNGGRATGGEGRATCGRVEGDSASQLGRAMPHDEFPSRRHRRPPGSNRRGAYPVARRLPHGRRPRGSGSYGRGTSWVLGFVELSLGDATEALPHLRRSFDLRNAFVHEPGNAPLSSATCSRRSIATGELHEADAILATWEARAGSARPRLGTRHPRPLSRAAGRGPRRPRRRPRVLRALDRRACPRRRPVLFARARCSPTGARSGVRRNAAPPERPSRGALADFERLGAQPWVDHTGAELPESAAAHPPATNSPRPNGNRSSSRQAGPTARSPQPSPSPSARSRPPSPHLPQARRPVALRACAPARCKHRRLPRFRRGARKVSLCSTRITSRAGREHEKANCPRNHGGAAGADDRR